MVKAARAKTGAGAFRSLNAPEPLQVQADAQGIPSWLLKGREWLKVSAVEDYWRIEDEWWRNRSVRRTYFEAVTEDGRRVTLFRDETSDKWYQQRYA